MADVTAKKTIETKANSGRGSYKIADGVTLYEGALVGLQSGYLNHWDETGQFVGVLIGGEDRLNDGTIIGETSDSKPPEGYVNDEGVTLMHLDSVGGSPTAAKVGALVWCSTSNTDDMTLTDTTNPPVGYMSRYRSATDVDVTLFSTAVHLAGVAAGGWIA